MIEQTRNTPILPIRLCSGGNTTSIQNIWENPEPAMKIEIRRGENPSPPSETGVNQNTGSTEVAVSNALELCRNQLRMRKHECLT
jgi:hypothetical protein